MKGCDIVLVVHNQLNYTRGCIESILKYTSIPFKIIVVDNASSNETLEYLETAKTLQPDKIALIKNQSNEGWLRAVNRGIQESRYPFICVMNNDTLVTPQWLEEMIRVAEAEQGIGIVNPCWKGKPRRVSVESYAERLRRFSGQYIEMDWCRGFCFLIRREVIGLIGGLDTHYDPAYYDDWDFSLRALKAGFKCVLAKGSFVYHFFNVTYPEVLGWESFNELFEKNRRVFYQKWGIPLRIAFILDKKMRGEGKFTDDFPLELLRNQHKLYVWTTQRKPNFPPHTNLRISYIPSPFLFSICLFRLWNNYKKAPEKRYDVIFTGNETLYRFLKRYTKGNLVMLGNGEAGRLDERIRECVEQVKAEKRRRLLSR